MLVFSDTGQCRAWLTLAAREQRHDLVAREIAVGVGAAEGRQAIEIAPLARDLDHPVHRAADRDDLAAICERGLRDRAHAGDIRREGGDADAVLGLRHDVLQRRRQHPPRWGFRRRE